MIQVHDPMTGVAIETERRKCLRGSVDAGRVTACAAVGETILVPGRLLRVNHFFSAPIRSKDGLRVKHLKFPIASLFEESHAMPAAHKEIDLRSDSRE